MENLEQQILGSQLPILVDFYATWCGPCKNLTPVLDQIQTEYTGKMDVLKVDVDEQFELAQKYEIKSIPTLMLFKNGAVVKTIKGFLPKTQLLAQLSPEL